MICGPIGPGSGAGTGTDVPPRSAYTVASSFTRTFDSSARVSSVRVSRDSHTAE